MYIQGLTDPVGHWVTGYCSVGPDKQVRGVLANQSLVFLPFNYCVYFLCNSIPLFLIFRHLVKAIICLLVILSGNI